MIFCLLALLFTDAFAQSSPPKSTRQAEANEPVRQLDILSFPSLEKLEYYRSDGRLKRITALLKAGKEERAYRLVSRYARRFAMSNFRLDGALMVEWARLSARFGPPGEAVLITRLLKKHSPVGMDSAKVSALYDTLELERPGLFLSIRQYYRLVVPDSASQLREPSTVTSLGTGVNSPAEDYAPTFGNTDDLLLFTSKRNRHQTDLTAPPDEDLFISRRKDGIWQPARELRMINTFLNEGSACLSRDGKTLYFSRCDAPRSFGNCDLYVAKLGKDSVWKDITNLGANINTGGWESHPSLSRSGDTLFFASNRVGGFGLSDIYFSVRDKSGKWGKAQNAGPLINTRATEVSPFFHHRFNALYFSSDGHPMRLGDFDIYRCSVGKDGFSEPYNIGPLINSAGTEYYYSMDSESGEIVFTRSASLVDETLDIYTFPMPMEAQPEAITWLTGTVRDSINRPVRGVIRLIDLDQGVEIAPRILTAGGAFQFRLINRRKYKLVLYPTGYGRKEQEFVLDGDRNMEWQIKP